MWMTLTFYLSSRCKILRIWSQVMHYIRNGWRLLFVAFKYVLFFLLVTGNWPIFRASHFRIFSSKQSDSLREDLDRGHLVSSRIQYLHGTGRLWFREGSRTSFMVKIWYKVLREDVHEQSGKDMEGGTAIAGMMPACLKIQLHVPLVSCPRLIHRWLRSLIHHTDMNLPAMRPHDDDRSAF